MANEKNLKPVRTKQEARERGRNGGIASGKVRKEKKEKKWIIDRVLDAKTTIKEKGELIDQFKKDGKLTIEEVGVLKQAQAMANGDIRAYQDFMDRKYGKAKGDPVVPADINITLKLPDDIV